MTGCRWGGWGGSMGWWIRGGWGEGPGQNSRLKQLLQKLPPVRRQGRVGEGLRGLARCLWIVAPGATQHHPSLPLPSQGEGPKKEIEAESAPTKELLQNNEAWRATEMPGRVYGWVVSGGGN